MTKNDIAKAVENLPDDLVMDAHEASLSFEASDSGEVLIMKHHSIRKAACIAAAACLVLALGITAFATDFFGLRNLSTEREGKPAVIISAGNEIDADTEWANWLEEKKATNVPDPENIDADDIDFYYGAYSQEAKDKLHSIAKQFNLKLFSDRSQCDSMEQLYGLLHTSAFLPAGSGIGSGTIYDMKSVWSFTTDAILENNKVIHYDFYLTEAGYFMPLAEMFTNAEEYEESAYSVSGMEITLSLGKDRSYILARTDDYSLAVYIRAGSENTNDALSSFDFETVTIDDLKLFADSIDFTAIANIYDRLES